MEQGPPKNSDEKGKKIERKHGPPRPVATPRIPSTVNPEFEGFKEKFIRKVKENPVVPIGLAVTIGVLIRGLGSLRSGDRELSQKMMRYRVIAQGITIFAVLGGVWKQSLSQASNVEGTNSKP